MLRLIQAATTQPVTAEEAKLQTRVEVSAEDTLIEQYIAAAVRLVEDRTGLVLAPSVFRVERSDWWAGDLCILVAPVGDITEVSYLDEDGDEQVVDPTLYRWRRTKEGAEIWLLDAFDAPDVAEERKDSVRITVSAGFEDPASSGSGDDPELALPATAKQAILLLVGAWFENREETVIGVSVSALPTSAAAEHMMQQLRIFR